MIRSIAGSIARPLAVAITGASGGAAPVPDPAEDVRALFSANGGDFTGTMLDFGKTDALWQDTGATTPAGDGDTLARVDDQSGEGNNATQSSAASRPTLTTDPFGTLVAQPDGTDDFMDLPDGVLGDGTKHVHVFAAYALDQANSATFPGVVDSGSTGGFTVQHDGTTGHPRTRLLDGDTTGFNTPIYERALTAHETVVRADLYSTAGTGTLRLNGAEVDLNSPGYTSLDDPGSATILGRSSSSNNLAGTCHGIVILTGSRAMTAEEIATVEAYLADLASDTLLTADADTVLSRFFRPATDLNVTEGFDYADTAALTAVWTDDSAANASVTQDVANGEMDLNSGPAGERATVQRGFPTRVGYQYTATFTRTAGSVAIFKVGTTQGGGDVANSSTDSHTFVAQSSTTWVELLGTNVAATTQSFSDFTLTEAAATGDYWDLLDDTRMYADDQGTLVEAEGTVLNVLPKGRADLYGPELVTNGTFDTGIDGWTASSAAVLSWDSVNQRLEIDAPGSQDGATTSVTAEIGKLYRVTFDLDVSEVTTPGIRVQFGGVTVVDPPLSSSMEFLFLATATSGLNIRSNFSANRGTYYVDNVSVKEVLGYPLRQTSAASRPLLSYAPNALLQSIAFYGKDTTTGSIVGTDLVTNGTFDTDTSGWSASASASLSVVGGQMRITTSGTSQYAYQALSTVVGQTYSVEYDYEVNNSANGMDAYAANTINNGISNIATAFHANAATGSGRLVFEATATTTYLHFKARSVGDIDVDNISCTPALADASGNNAGPVVYGTLSRTAVATGANVVAYSGFTGGVNYFESADDYFDPGTSDWSITRVHKIGGSTDRRPIFEYGTAGSSTPTIRLSIENDGSGGRLFRLRLNTGSGYDAYQGGVVTTDEWSVVTVSRRGDTAEVWVDGELVASGGFTNVSAVTSMSGGIMRHMLELDSGFPNYQGTLSSIMLDANYAPTEAEITALHTDLAAIHSGENADFTYARLTFDGTDDYFEAVDPDADLAITGDLTILSASNPSDLSSGFRSIVQSGDPVSTVDDIAYTQRTSTAEPQFYQANATSVEVVASTSSFVVGNDEIYSTVRDGADLTHGRDVTSVETDTFATVTSPTAGSAPITRVGSLTAGGQYAEGSILQLAVIDRALSTGLLLHAERALQEKIT